MIEAIASTALRVAALFERRLTIAIFHRVLDEPDPLLPDELGRDDFRERMRWLTASFEVMPLGAALTALRRGRLPPRALSITFDDGYADNHANAVPILQGFGASATFFVTTRYLNGGMMWNDRVIEAVRAWPETVLDTSEWGGPACDPARSRTGVIADVLGWLKYRDFDEREQIASMLLERSGSEVRDLMMNEQQVRDLARCGMEIGGHTHGHPILTRVTPDDARREILVNKQILEDITGERLRTFAYPNGRPGVDYGPEHVHMLEEAGFHAGLTTSAGTVSDASPAFELPRFSPWDRNKVKYFARLAANYFRDGTRASANAEREPS